MDVADLGYVTRAVDGLLEVQNPDLEQGSSAQQTRHKLECSLQGSADGRHSISGGVCHCLSPAALEILSS